MGEGLVEKIIRLPYSQKKSGAGIGDEGQNTPAAMEAFSF
jgi:hypothetical protein